MTNVIYKVGLVLLRNAGGEEKICLTQVKAKNPAEQEKVDFGLPKGTRRYLEHGQWHDARDEKSARAHRDQLEPLLRTLAHEAQEEAGLPSQLLASAPIYELGERPFHSRSTGQAYAIAWYLVLADETLVAQLNPNPSEAHRVGWFSQSEISALQSRNAINPEYALVIAEALACLRDGALTPIPFAPR